MARADDAAKTFEETAVASDDGAFLRFAERLPDDVPHDHEPYRFAREIWREDAALVRANPGIVKPFLVGRSVLGRPIWGFRIHDPATPVEEKVLVFGGIHALEWIGVEAAEATLESLVANPPRGVEVTVIPILNVDGRAFVEADLLAGQNHYRRANANHVDLNRDYEINRDPRAVWRVLLPDYYSTSPAPLSQPESQAMDALAGQEHFNASVSLHAFGGFIYYPWGGRFHPTADDHEFFEIGSAMNAAQGAHSYRVKQLCHWWFLFRIHGAELDHFYGKYGTRAFLIEIGRSGLNPFEPATFHDYFDWYNPADPERNRTLARDAVLGLVRYYETHDGTAPPTPPVLPR